MGGLIDGIPALGKYMHDRAAEVQARYDEAKIKCDAMTFRDFELSPDLKETTGANYRLNVSINLAWQKGMNVGPFDPEDREEVTRRVARTLGRDVERNILIGRVPGTMGTVIPENSSRFGWGPEMTLADAYALTTARVTGASLRGVVWVIPETGDVWVGMDGASKVWETLDPSPSVRERAFLRGTNAFSGPGRTSLAPVICFFVSGKGKHHDPVLYYDPEHLISPVLAVPVPGLYSAVRANITDEEIDRTLAFGEEVGEAVADSGIVSNYIQAFPELRAGYALEDEAHAARIRGLLPPQLSRGIDTEVPPELAAPQLEELQRDYAAERRSRIKGAMPRLLEAVRGRTAPFPEHFPQLPLDQSSLRMTAAEISA